MENPVELVNRRKPAGSAALPPEPEADADGLAVGLTDGLAVGLTDGLADGAAEEVAEGRADAEALCEVAGGAARREPGE
jgi:hypothetical protein